MRLPAVLVIGALVGALVVMPMMLESPGGEPIMTAADWAPVKEVSGEAGASSPTVFRWRDANGYWQFSDVRPEGLAVEEIQSIEIARTMTMPSEAFGDDRWSEGTKGAPKADVRLVSSRPQSTRARTDTGAQMVTTEDALEKLQPAILDSRRCPTP